MREYRFDPNDPTPTVAAVLAGPKASMQLKLVFDTGCSITEIDTRIMRYLGYTRSLKVTDIDVKGVKGPSSDGELFDASAFYVFGSKFGTEQVVCSKLDNMKEDGYHGLLGWNMIRHFELEMNGPEGLLRVRKATQG